MKKILIIEDDESNRRILEMTTKGMEVRVITAVNGEEGFEIAEREKPDLILLDVMMPKMSGLDTLRRLREHQDFQTTPVLVVSAKASQQDRKNAMNAGATEFLTKPFRVKDVQEAIERHL